MLAVLNHTIRLLATCPLDAPDRITAIVLASEASEAGGYVRGASAAILERLEGSLVKLDSTGWYFPALRTRARQLQRQSKYNSTRQKRRQTTPAHAGARGVGSGGDVVGSGWGDIEGGPGGEKEGRPRGGEEEAKGGGKRRHTTKPSSYDENVVERRQEGHGLSVGQGYLFPMGESGQPSADGTFVVTGVTPDSFTIANAAPPKKSKPSWRDASWSPIWECVAQLTGADRVVSKGHISRITSLLLQAEPPYTVEEVQSLRPLLVKTSWFDGKLSCGMIEKHIGLVRATAPASAAPVSQSVTLCDLNPRELQMVAMAERNPTLAHYRDKAFAQAAERKRQLEARS